MARRLLLPLCLLAVLAAPPGKASARVALRYRGRVAQTARYRLLLKATGVQTSLGETRPMSIDAEFELRQKVVATGPAGTLICDVSATPIKIKDPTGTFDANGRSRSLATRVTTTPTGEVLAAVPLSEDHVGPYQRAFAALLTQPGVLLPTGPASIGDSWEISGPTGAQRGRFAALSDTPIGPAARLIVTTTNRLEVREGSTVLGVNTISSGSETRTDQLELLLGQGVTLSDEGTSLLVTHGEITLDLPEGRKRFPISSRLRVEFELRLTKLDGMPIGGG